MSETTGRARPKAGDRVACPDCGGAHELYPHTYTEVAAADDAILCYDCGGFRQVGALAGVAMVELLPRSEEEVLHA